MTQKIAILGPGLLGTSIALAARRVGDARLAMWARRPEVIGEIRERGIVDQISGDIAAVVADATTIVFCVPIGAMPGLARTIEPLIPAGSLVTDVGSVKASIVAELGTIFRERGRFIGSHPMAGSDKTGHASASADLFSGRVCILTPDDSTAPDVVGEVSEFWEMLGCRIRCVLPAEHDEIVALISHLPHLLAATLMNTVSARNPGALDFYGPGFFDHTRVASGDPGMWAEILGENRAAVRANAEAMIEKLRDITKLLDRETTMNEFLTRAKALRDSLRP